MRIAIDIRALMEGKTTGVEVYLTNLLRNIFEIDKSNEYVLFANSFKKPALPEFKYPNVTAIVTRYPNKFFSLAQKLGFPKMESLVGRIDLCFSPHWRVLALKSSTPIVVTFHDLFFEIMPEFFTWRRRVWHRFMNYRGAARRANRIIAVSENTKKDLVDMYGVEEEKIQVIYPGIQNGSKGSHSAKGYFLYFGTFEPRKNIETVLAAYELYRSESKVQRPLVIAGSRGWKTKICIPEELKSRIGVQENVTEEEKAKLYKNAFAFVFPSFYEGFGFPILEAAAAGVPVIASFNSALSEIGKDFVLFANPFRPSQFAQAMLELEGDEQLCKNLGERGYMAAQNFMWQTAAQKTLRLFEEAVA